MNLVFYLLLLTASPNTEIHQVKLPDEVKEEVCSLSNNNMVPKELESLNWYRWTSKNFVVCSLNDQKAKYLNQNLEHVKSWFYGRWGLPDVDFVSECRLICVDNKTIYRKYFRKDKSQVEVREVNGKKLTVIFLLIDEEPSKVIPGPISEACLFELEQRYGLKLGLWTRGMAKLSLPLAEIRQELASLQPLVTQQDAKMFFSKGLLTATPEDWSAMNQEQRNLFDKNALAFCLLLRQEFGEQAFLKFLQESAKTNPEQTLRTIYRFGGYEEFDRSFRRYMVDLTSDVSGVRPDHPTPDQYLQIKSAHAR